MVLPLRPIAARGVADGVANRGVAVVAVLAPLGVAVGVAARGVPARGVPARGVPSRGAAPCGVAPALPGARGDAPWALTFVRLTGMAIEGDGAEASMSRPRGRS